MRNLIFTSVFLVLLSIPVVVLSTPGDLGYRYIHNQVISRLLITSFTNSDFNSASADFSSAGNLSFSPGPSHLNPPYTKNVAFLESNFGSVPWVGLAIGYTASDQPCATYPGGSLTGNCTMSNGADYALIRFNSYYAPFSAAVRANLIRHEFAHILGLSHSGCSPTDSVMAPSISCTPLRTTLQPIDQSIINTWYP